MARERVPARARVRATLEGTHTAMNKQVEQLGLRMHSCRCETAGFCHLGGECFVPGESNRQRRGSPGVGEGDGEGSGDGEGEGSGEGEGEGAGEGEGEGSGEGEGDGSGEGEGDGSGEGEGEPASTQRQAVTRMPSRGGSAAKRCCSCMHEQYSKVGPWQEMLGRCWAACGDPGLRMSRVSHTWSG